MQPRERVETVLRGGTPERIPFTCYEQFIAKCAIDRQLRNLGMCYIHWDDARDCLSGVHSVRKHCEEAVLRYTDRATGKVLRKTTVETPKGILTSLVEEAGFTEWTHERMFKNEDDYESLISYINDTNYAVDLDAVGKNNDLFGNDGFLMPWVGFSPIQDLIITWMGVETFSMEWADHLSRLNVLIEALYQRDIRLMQALCKTDLAVVNYCGNISPAILGRQRAIKYVFPVINEMAEMLHKSGKQLAVHFDDNCALLADLIAESGIDVIEAFTPAPDTDMTVAQARVKWPQKTLWINFPSSQHWEPDEVIADTVRRIVNENGRPDKLLIGVTEDMPQTEWKRSMLAIAETIEGIRL